MKQFGNMWFNARLALCELAAMCGLFSVLELIGLRVCGGTDARGGYVTDLNDTANSDFAAFFKETYGGLENALRTAAYLHNRLAGKGQMFDIQGSKLVMSVITGHNTGFAFTSGGSALPVGGRSTGIRPEAMYSRLIQTCAWDDETIQLSQSEKGAFISAMGRGMESVQETGGVVLNQALQRNKASALGVVASVDNDKRTITLSNTGLSNTVSGDRCKYIMESMYIDIGSASGVPRALLKGLQVVSIDHTNNKIVVDADADTAQAGDYVWLGILGGVTNSYNRGVSGLDAWVGSTTNTVWGIDRSLAANAKFRPVRINANGGSVSQQLMRRLIGTVQQWGADKGQPREGTVYEGAAIYTSIPDKNAYGDVLMNMKRIVNDMELKGGWKGIEAEGYAMIGDADAAVGRMRFLNLDDWGLGSPNGGIAPVLWSPDGLVLRQVPGYDRWVSMHVTRLELGCKMPNRSGEIYGLNTAAYALES